MDSRIEVVIDGLYRIGEYDITNAGGRLRCICPAFRHGASCWHRDLVEQELDNPQGTGAIELEIDRWYQAMVVGDEGRPSHFRPSQLCWAKVLYPGVLVIVDRARSAMRPVQRSIGQFCRWAKFWMPVGVPLPSNYGVRIEQVYKRVTKRGL